MSDWYTYHLADFVPFTADVYFRLMERTGESIWPMSLMLPVLLILILSCVRMDRKWLVWILLSMPWFLVGWVFFLSNFTEIYWISVYIGSIFVGQAGGLLLFGVYQKYAVTGQDKAIKVSGTGLILILAGALLYPLLPLLAGGSVSQAEVFGIHPDPTVLVTLGLILALAGRWYLLLAVVPVAWLILSVAILWVLPGERAMFQSITLILCLLLFTWAVFIPRRLGRQHKH